MEQYLIIQIERIPGRVAWLPADPEGRPLGLVQTGTPAEAAGMAGERRVIVLVPAESILLARVSLPGGRRTAQWKKAVSYSLEERLADDVERLHFATGQERDVAGKLPVAAVSHDDMSAWLGMLRDAGIEPHAMVPDCLALPWSPGRVTIAEYEGRTLCRDGPCDGFACEAESFETMFNARMRVTDPDMPMDALAVEAGLLAALAPGAVTAPLDLLQDAYRRRTEVPFARWRTPAALAAVFILLAGGHWLSGYLSLMWEYDRLRTDVETVFGELLPGEPMADARVQVERRLLGRSTGDGEWLRMLDALSTAVPQVTGVELQSITWRPGTMEVNLTAQRAEQLDALRNRIGDAGQDASIESASSRGDRVDGRLRIRGGG